MFFKRWRETRKTAEAEVPRRILHEFEAWIAPAEAGTDKASAGLLDWRD
jgi:hypothetical protein